MEFSFTGVSRITLENKPGSTKSQLIATDFFLEISENLDDRAYLDNEDLPTSVGSEMLINAFVAGIAGAIANAHQQGFKNDADNLRYVISELERHFVQQTTVEKGEF